MPAKFWGEAVRHAVYLLNRLPTKALGDRTPFEAWMGRKPHLANLRVFGCVAYVKNTTPHLKKLDDRSPPMVYLGVEEGCKAHRLFDPRHGKLQVSRDVVFQENSEWTWTAGANHEENLPEFMVEDALNTDEVIVIADIEVGTEDVTPPATAVVPMTRASSPSTSSSSTHTTTSPDSHEGPVRFRSIANIYANTEEVVGIDEEENEVMLMMSEEPTCYQEAATEACCILVGVYIDDLIVTGSSTGRINKFKQQMMIEFEMSDLGLLSYYLGIEVEQQKSRILFRQSTYAKKILSQFKMTDCNATKHPMEPKTQLHKDLEGTPVDATEYRRIIGCLRYLLHTRPDLSYPVGMESRYMERPTTMYHKVVKQILRYLKGTIHFGLTYIKGPQEISIFGYSDSDLAGDLDGRKSTSGMAFYFNESLVSWNSQKQKTVALSSCEAEFMAATTAACRALWLRSLTSKLTGEKPKPVTLFVDNKSAIALMKNSIFHGRSKHIDTRFHFIRECVENGQIVVEFINTGEQRADVLTKALLGVKFAVMRQLLGVRDLEPCLLNHWPNTIGLDMCSIQFSTRSSANVLKDMPLWYLQTRTVSSSNSRREDSAGEVRALILEGEVGPRGWEELVVACWFSNSIVADCLVAELLDDVLCSIVKIGLSGTERRRPAHDQLRRDGVEAADVGTVQVELSLAVLEVINQNSKPIEFFEFYLTFEMLKLKTKKQEPITLKAQKKGNQAVNEYCSDKEQKNEGTETLLESSEVEIKLHLLEKLNFNS
ncbi:hypothetical protein ZIOFF_072198 [Zingiber officinale]|uniref:Reverse transcriptase Ty1/copia-type domain-containing protein n=1 Tax=Zingiber officinale TaxID=94328 RepID=A0A8J5BFD3_ZINOF|nr:hypothetical protein ZIOFF_072198 [Zingiber officinale]